MTKNIILLAFQQTFHSKFLFYHYQKFTPVSCLISISYISTFNGKSSGLRRAGYSDLELLTFLPTSLINTIGFKSPLRSQSRHCFGICLFLGSQLFLPV